MIVKIPKENVKIKIKFWGEDDHQVLRAENAASDLMMLKNEIIYNVSANIAGFHKYLSECKRIEFFILDKRNDKPIGVVLVNLL